jgi:hypothetical protein
MRLINQSLTLLLDSLRKEFVESAKISQEDFQLLLSEIIVSRNMTFLRINNSNSSLRDGSNRGGNKNGKY